MHVGQALLSTKKVPNNTVQDLFIHCGGVTVLRMSMFHCDTFEQAAVFEQETASTVAPPTIGACPTSGTTDTRRALVSHQSSPAGASTLELAPCWICRLGCCLISRSVSVHLSHEHPCDGSVPMVGFSINFLPAKHVPLSGESLAVVQNWALSRSPAARSRRVQSFFLALQAQVHFLVRLR